MNWVVHKSDKMLFHTDLKMIFQPILEDIYGMNWLLADLNFQPWMKDEKILMGKLLSKYSVLSGDEFNKVLKADFQMIWGVIIGVPCQYNIEVDNANIPYPAGETDSINYNGFQLPNAEIEIICFDSSFTIIKFCNPLISAKFKVFFPEAVPLENF